MANPLQALRDRMAEYHIDAYLIPTADFHGSEYVGDHFACRRYVSGFTGSAGTLLVFPHWAGLWTDGRYFLQAEAQLQGSGIRLMKMGQPGVPTIEGFLRSSLQPGQTLGFDGRCVDARTGRRYHQLTKQLGAKMNHERDLVGEIWPDRPPLSAQPAWLLEEAYAGLSREEKLRQVRGDLAAQGAEVLLLTTLEDIGWLLNLRGGTLRAPPWCWPIWPSPRRGAFSLPRGRPFPQRCWRRWRPTGCPCGPMRESMTMPAAWPRARR